MPRIGPWRWSLAAALLLAGPAVAPAQVTYNFASGPSAFTSVSDGPGVDSPWTHAAGVWSTPGLGS